MIRDESGESPSLTLMRPQDAKAMYLLRLFGGSSLEGESGPISGPALRQRLVAVLAMLAVAREKGCSRDKLIAYLWSEADQERARHRLANAVYELRKSLGEGAVLATGEVLRLNPDVIQSDVWGFEDSIDAEDLEAAAGLYGGAFLDGFHIDNGPEFERWLDSERQRLAERYAKALEALAERAEMTGDGLGAVEWWRRLVAYDPFNTRVALRLMQAMAESGDRPNALQYAQEHERLLRDELDMEPDAELVALVERLRRDAGREGRPVRQVVNAALSETQAEEAVERLATATEFAEALEPVLVSQPAGRRVGLARVIALYAATSVAVLAAAYFLMLQLGLPDWFFSGAAFVLLVCLPIFGATALVQAAAASAPTAVRRWLSWRNAIGVGVGLFALLGVAVTGYTGMRVMGIGPWGTLIAKGAVEERGHIILADFENLTRDSLLGLVVTDLFRTDLSQSSAVRVAGREYVKAVLQRMERDPDQPLDYDLAREVAIREGLKAVVTGQVGSLGQGYVVSVRLTAVGTGEELIAHRETAAGDSALIPAIDRLSKRMRERIGESLTTVRSSLPLMQVRTASLEALRLYTEAFEENRQVEWTRAHDLLNRAIEIDSAFAAAYVLRAKTSSPTGMRAQRIADATKAYELSHRLPPLEQYQAEASYHRSVTGDDDKLLNIYLSILELDPDDIEVLYDLGWRYYNRCEYAHAEERFRRSVELDSLNGLAWGRLVMSQFNQGKFVEAEDTWRQYERKLPEHVWVAWTRIYMASALGDYSASEAHLLDLLPRVEPWHRLIVEDNLGPLDLIQGRLSEAVGHYRNVMTAHEQAGSSGAVLSRAVWLGLSYVAVGDPDRAVEVVDAALQHHPLSDVKPVERPYERLAAFYAQAGRPERSKELLAEYEAAVQPSLFNPGHGTLGQVALAEGRPLDALAEFRTFDGVAGVCPMNALGPLGRAYELAGQADSAIAVYERYLITPFIKRSFWDSFSLALTYERLGALYEQQGDRPKAIHYYGKLVELWNDADPELQPRVEAARRAIESLSARYE
jgi:DNA-binding SARP family transcriptional activator/Tfp pilus assembly protein PilF